MTNKAYVYVICDPRSSGMKGFHHLPIYVGKGTGNRWKSHIKEARGENQFRGNTQKVEAIKSILDEGLEPLIIFYSTELSHEEAYNIEEKLIAEIGRTQDGGPLTNVAKNQRSLGGGKKGMVHQKARTKEHRAAISKYKQGWTPSDKTRALWKSQRTGRKMSEETRSKMSASATKARSATWKVASPTGEVEVVRDLKKWCEDKGVSYFTVWGNRAGYKVEKLSDESLTAKLEGYVHITDADSGEVLVSKSNQIHFENFSEAIAQSMANRASGHIHQMAFGNGASTVSGTGAVTYFPPNVTGQSAQLYNETYAKVVDDMSPMNTDPSYNQMRVQHAQNATFSDIVVTCTLRAQEPADQGVFDNEVDNETPYVFDELGLKAFDPAGNGKLLTHVIFHPVQKSLNRTIEIVYTVRIYMS